MTLQNVEQPGVSRVQNRTRKRIKCASRQVDAHDLRYVQNTQRSVRIGLRSGLKYDMFSQTANIRCMNRIFRCLTYKQYKREDERDRNGHVVVVVVGAPTFQGASATTTPRPRSTHTSSFFFDSCVCHHIETAFSQRLTRPSRSDPPWRLRIYNSTV